MQFERFAAFAVACFAIAAMPASAATLDRIRETGSIKLGYLADAPTVFLSRRIGGSRRVCRGALPAGR